MLGVDVCIYSMIWLHTQYGLASEQTLLQA